jgi:hypothetical protein
MAQKRTAQHAVARRDTKPRIFISYRRADAAALVGHLYDRLINRYGRECIFRDVDNIPLASNFRDDIRADLSRCDVVLVVIGPRWLGVNDAGARIKNSDDPVRIEVETALRTGATVVPILVEGASMPSPHEVPESLSSLCSLNAGRMEPGKDFEQHARELFSCIDGILQSRGKFVTRFPAWALSAAAGCTLFASAGIAALLLTLAGWGPKPSPGMLLLSAIGISAALAASCALLFGDAAARRRLPIVSVQRHSAVASVAVGAVAFALLLLSGEFLQAWLPAHAVANPVELARRLRTEFIRARDSAERSEPERFKGAEALIQALRALDPQNGHAWYFAGEIKRVQTSRLFTAKSCFKGWVGEVGNLDTYQQDFYAYREVALTLPTPEIGTEPSSEICYARANGYYCPQRLAWIYHLLANDFFVHASALDGARRYTALEQAKEFAQEARRYHRPEGGDGFNQCNDTASLLENIAEALDESRPAIRAKTTKVYR